MDEIDALENALSEPGDPPPEAGPRLAALLADSRLAGEDRRRLPGLVERLSARMGAGPLRQALDGAWMNDAPHGPAKAASGRGGLVVAGSPHAAVAGARILGAGGNAVDAAVAACFAMGVADPPNASPLGRCHLLIVNRDGSAAGLDGATESPAGTPPLEAGTASRSGFGAVPVPGNPKALCTAVERHGRLPLAQVLAPAIALAEEGFTIPAHLGAVWPAAAPDLARDPGAARSHLKPDGAPWRGGETFRQPALAGLLRRLAAGGPAALASGEAGQAIVSAIADGGGYVTLDDLQAYRPLPGEVLRAPYRDWEVVTLGGNAWGHTLLEMLNILGQFAPLQGEPTGAGALTVALAMRCALADRPQALGTLKPKPGGLPLARLASPELARERAEQIRAVLDGPPAALAGFLERTPIAPAPHGGDTTHLSAIDAQGNAVALTTSLGPYFGSRVAVPDLGVLLPYSYRMATDPAPGARDQTEMTPTVLCRGGAPLLALGGAGSELIPGAVLQVILNVVDRGLSLGPAVAAPRLNWSDEGRLRVHCDLAPAALRELEARGLPLALSGRSHVNHLGIVQAAARDADSTCHGAADPAYDGAAALSP